MTSPFVIVIFGATGDLAHNKLLPALFSLYKQNLLGPKFFIVGFSRQALSDEQYRKTLIGALELEHDEEWKGFTKHIYYQQGIFEEKISYSNLAKKLKDLGKTVSGRLSNIFYLATTPQNYETILDMLYKQKKLLSQRSEARNKLAKLVIEKPFGKDLETAKMLDKKLHDYFVEWQVFRVDHYLSKETMQNMIAFRFANGIFEPVWNKNYIDHVQITWAEKKGIGSRGVFFDGVGMVRDVMQNHLLQIMATVTMEQPKSFEREAIRDARANAIKAVRLAVSDIKQNVVRGQYKGYRQEKNVNPTSTTETFAAMKLFVETERFSGVPFYLRAGKNMPQDVIEISIVFIQTCHILFKEYGCPEIGNVLTIRIQPDEGITLRVVAKTPGNKLALNTVDMRFSYHQTFGGHGANAYDKILLDILAGDQMLFNRADELESSWELISKILQQWSSSKKKNSKIPQYKKGTWGPKDAIKLIEKDRRSWL